MGEKKKKLHESSIELVSLYHPTVDTIGSLIRLNCKEGPTLYRFFLYVCVCVGGCVCVGAGLTWDSRIEQCAKQRLVSFGFNYLTLLVIRLLLNFYFSMLDMTFGAHLGFVAKLECNLEFYIRDEI